MSAALNCTCERCGVAFYRKPSRTKTAKFCSLRCTARRGDKHLSHATVRHFIAVQCEETGLTEAEILYHAKRIPTQARRRAWAAIIDHSGCSVGVLARVWGVDRQAVRRGLQILRKAA